ncbi:hypothetical protein [Escherichia phage E20-1]|nr:hypothetical protein [Escherichia phage E20-1]
MASLLTGATQQFTAEAELSDGSTSTTGFDWSVAGGGAISVSGLFTAPGSPQTADITVTATLKDVSGTAVISEIKAPIPDPASIAVTGGGLTGDTLTITVPDATNLTASVSPAGAPQGVTWEIADPTKATVTTAGRVTAVAAGSTTLTVKSSTKPSVTKVINVVVNPQPPTIAAKAAITGKSGGDSVAFTDMFTVQRSSATNYNFVVTPTAAGSVNATSGLLTLSDTANDNVTVKATHKTQTSVTATSTIEDVIPKLTGLVVSAVSDGSVAGDTLTISDPSQPGVFNIASVPQGAPLGTIVYDVEGTDADKLSITISGDALTITLSGAITSEDTKVTLRTDPGSTVFKTYTVKSGA